MQWHGHVEPISGILRVFEEDKEYGDPYEFACTVRWIDHRTVELAGVDKTPKTSMWRAILQTLSEAGVETIIYYRRGRKKQIVIADKEF